MSHRFALFVVKDPLIPAEGCPWAFYLHLFNCQPQITLFPVSLSAPWSGSSSIPSLCTPPLEDAQGRIFTPPLSHCAGFSQSLWSVAVQGCKHRFSLKGTFPLTSALEFAFSRATLQQRFMRGMNVHPCLSLPCFQCLSSQLRAEAPFTGDSLQLLFLKVTQFLPQEK